MDGSTHLEDTWSVAGRTFRSRLIVGTGKYKDYAQNAAAAEAAGAEIVTVALRRVNLDDPSQPRLTDHVSPERFTFMPNTAGCHTGEEAVREITRQIPLGRPGNPADVARAVLFLASEFDGFITGAALDINGGVYWS